MSFSSGIGSTRREFFRAAARYAVLSGLAALAGLTEARKRLSGQKCVNLGLCDGCGVFKSCGLPQALSAKMTKRRGVYEPHREKS